MINLKEVYKIQSEYGVADDSFKDSEISFEDYLAQCRMFISRLEDVVSDLEMRYLRDLRWLEKIRFSIQQRRKLQNATVSW